MKGDFTRRSFSRGKHYSGVRMQQGRVQLDADWNEQADIQSHLRHTHARDALGPSGAPKAQGSAHFALGIAPDGKDLTLAPGRFYVQGILCELEQQTSYLNQPDLPTPPYVTGEGAARALTLAQGTYLAYLDVWEQLVTALEDPQLREVALGGPDTTVRTRTVWQVKLLLVSTDPAATTWTTSLPGPGTGMLAARAQPQTVTEDASLVPAGAGYRRLENQLYRVEVHAVSSTGRVTAKWSRDNGAVVAPWLSGSGNTVTIGSSGRNEPLDFTAAPLVELTDDARELQGGAGLLYSVMAVSGATLTLDTTSAGSAGAFNKAAFLRNPKVRRWEGRLDWESAASSAPQWLPLEDGVEVKPGTGTYRVGDYWLIPARHLTTDVEWPRDGLRVPLPQLPHGVDHAYAPLALLRKAATLTVEDQRKVFPAATELTASDVRFDPAVSGMPAGLKTVQQAVDHLHQAQRAWSILLLPGDDVAAALAHIAPSQSARIHFGPGTFTLPSTLELSDKGDLQLTGSGSATRLIANTVETVFSFKRCRSVQVRDLYAQTSRVLKSHGVKGVLAFNDCPSVTVEHASLQCGAHWERGAACISVHNSAPAEDAASPASTARIRSCDLKIGHQQVGILLVNVDRSQVEDNVLTAYEKPAELDIAKLVEFKGYRTLMRRLVLSRLLVLTEPLTPSDYIVNGRLGPYYVYFDADRSLLTAWQDILQVESPRIEAAASHSGVHRHLRVIAYNLLRNKGTPGVAGLQSTTVTTFRNWFERWRASSPGVAAEGITVGGHRASEVRIRDNTLRKVRQGIHVGLSQYTGAIETDRDGLDNSAGRVHITGNDLHILMTAESVGERHGIFVSHCSALYLESNRVNIERKTFHSQTGIDAILVHGILGRLLSIRQNDLRNRALEPTNVGIRVKILNPTAASRSSWQVRDNLSSCQTPHVLEPPSIAG
jgi:hypothetical protein